MKVACFYPDSLWSAWGVSHGLVSTLRRMGHEVLDAPIVPGSEKIKRSQFPRHEELETCDLILVSGPEHIGKYIDLLYGEWAKLKVKLVGYLHETVEREDYGRLPIEEIQKRFDVLYTPAHQDQKYGLKWLPFGVDCSIFHPLGPEEQRVNDCTFIGLMYDKRKEYLASLPRFPLRIINVQGVDAQQTVENYAAELRRTKVLLNLPSLCEHLVTKVFESMACGAALVTPFMSGPGEENFRLFKNGTHCQMYGENPSGIVWQLLNEPEYRQQMAMKGCREVHEKHSLEKRLEEILK